MKIFGIGLHKTGTTSLAEALQRLGFRTSHLSGRQAEMTRRNRRTGRRLFFGMDHEFDAFTDQPCCYEYRRLDLDYPGSKFIWTHRDILSWIRSLERMNMMNIRQFRRGPDTFMDYDKWIDTYKKHMDDVPKYFAGRSDFLSFPICDGRANWQTLCAFLGVPIPSVKFPYANDGVKAYGPFKPLPRLTYRSEVQCQGEKDSHPSSTRKEC